MVDRSIDHPLTPKRRWFLKTSLAIGVVGATLGGATYWKRGVSEGVLTPEGRDIFKAVARALMWDFLPKEPAAQEARLQAHLVRVNEVLASMPGSSQVELAALLGALANLPTRWLMTGMGTSWSDASVAQINQALNTMRLHSLPTQTVPYHVLRDLSCLAFFSTPGNWSHAQYPGPVEI